MKEWYLIGTPSLTSGGFENDVFNSYRNDAMAEILDTELAREVEMCSFDLSERITIKAVIQDNLADTYLKSTNRAILTQIGVLKAGYYIYYEGEYWLIIGRPGNNKIYEKAIIVQCQRSIKWQNAEGKIIERWVNISSASKYDVGEGGNYIMYLASNNYTLLLPNDADSLTIDGKRVFIDLEPELGLLPEKVFKITRADDVLYNYHIHGGCIGLIADRDELNLDTDNQEIGICNYIPPVLPPDPEPETGDVVYEMHIAHKGSASIVAGGNSKKFTCFALASDGQEVNLHSLAWTVTCQEENKDFITYTVNEDLSISIRCAYNNKIIGTQFLLTASVYDHSASIFIEIGGGI